MITHEAVESTSVRKRIREILDDVVLTASVLNLQMQMVTEPHDVEKTAGVLSEKVERILRELGITQD